MNKDIEKIVETGRANYRDKETVVFVSYASEDEALAALITSNLRQLATRSNAQIDVTKDTESFTLGGSIGKEIANKLRPADILFVIFTGAMRPSVSYTGGEVGAFLTLIDEDDRNKTGRKRRIITMYIDEPPKMISDSLGIQLDITALQHGGVRTDIDPRNGLYRFFKDVADRIIDHSYRLRENGIELDDEARKSELNAGKLQKKAEIDAYLKQELIPTLKKEVSTKLSSLVKSESIEQVLLQIRWPPGWRRSASLDYLAGAKLSSEMGKAFDVFGLNNINQEVTWEHFCSQLEVRDLARPEATFIKESIQRSVRSGLNPGPVDNDQFFMSPANRQRYRIIVTRHYEFFDESAIMHMYLVPFISQYKDKSSSTNIDIMMMSALFRMTFIDSNRSEVTLKYFESIRFDKETFINAVITFVRDYKMIDGLSHALDLDNPKVILESYPNIESNVRSQLFELWANKKQKIMQIAGKIVEYKSKIIDSKDLESRNKNIYEFEPLIEVWLKELREYLEFVNPINQYFGISAASRLVDWFRGEQGRREKVDYREYFKNVKEIAPLLPVARGRRSSSKSSPVFQESVRAANKTH